MEFWIAVIDLLIQPLMHTTAEVQQKQYCPRGSLMEQVLCRREGSARWKTGRGLDLTDRSL